MVKSDQPPTSSTADTKVSRDPIPDPKKTHVHFKSLNFQKSKQQCKEQINMSSTWQVYTFSIFHLKITKKHQFNQPKTIQKTASMLSHLRQQLSQEVGQRGRGLEAVEAGHVQVVSMELLGGAKEVGRKTSEIWLKTCQVNHEQLKLIT